MLRFYCQIQFEPQFNRMFGLIQDLSCRAMPRHLEIPNASIRCLDFFPFDKLRVRNDRVRISEIY